ncbi:MAG: nicotinate-nucleotide diphosphorylase (carboxylating), partial [Elusimicrobiota bacterium]|nr:nicotinate-nucleotide diphosphorylase (carboxylating) [Elusimicrobiota bacterium]
MIDEIIKLAVDEDAGLGDITSENIFSPKDNSKAVFIAKDDMIICGGDIARQVFEYVEPRVKFRMLYPDGARVKKGGVIARISGPTLGLLKGERPALNFMQRMSAVASAAYELNLIAKKYGVMLVDTRKSLPGM